MESVFDGVRSSDGCVRQAATEELMKRMQDPGFLWTLVEFLETVDKSDGGLVDVVAITILQMVRAFWNGRTYGVDMGAFLQRILGLVFAVPFGNRGNFLEIIDHVLLDQSIDFSGMAGECERLIRKGEMCENLATAVQILECYLFFQTIPPIRDTDALEEMVRNFVVLLVGPLRSVAGIVSGGGELKEYECSVVKAIANIVKLFVMTKSKIVFQIGETREVLQLLVLVLQVNQIDAPVLKMKKEIGLLSLTLVVHLMVDIIQLQILILLIVQRVLIMLVLFQLLKMGELLKIYSLMT